MDRFIVYHLLEFHQYTQTLKSNMDRFIDNVTPLFYLKLIL